MQFRLLNLFAILSLAGVFLATATASTAAGSFAWTAVMFAIVAVYRFRDLPKQRRIVFAIEELLSMIEGMYWGFLLALVLGLPLYAATNWPGDPWRGIACGVAFILACQVLFPSLQSFRAQNTIGRRAN